MQIYKHSARAISIPKANLKKLPTEKKYVLHTVTSAGILPYSRILPDDPVLLEPHVAVIPGCVVSLNIEIFKKT